MPYTPEELKDLTWYQNLINEDEQRYLQRKELLELRATMSGSAYDGSLLLRNEAGSVLLFEDPYENKLHEDESTRIVYNTELRALKSDDSINEIIDREFREL